MESGARADPTDELRNVEYQLKYTNKKIKALNEKLAAKQLTRTLYISLIRELVSNLHNLEIIHQNILERKFQCENQKLSHEPSVYLRAYLPNKQRTIVRVRKGVSLRIALGKPLRLRNFICAMCEVFRIGEERETIPWDTDLSEINATEVVVRTLDKLPIISHISHQYYRKNFFALALCDSCNGLIFKGFRCAQCTFKFHQKCSRDVPNICTRDRLSDLYYRALLARDSETQTRMHYHPEHPFLAIGRTRNNPNRSNSAPNIRNILIPRLLRDNKKNQPEPGPSGTNRGRSVSLHRLEKFFIIRRPKNKEEKVRKKAEKKAVEAEKKAAKEEKKREKQAEKALKKTGKHTDKTDRPRKQDNDAGKQGGPAADKRDDKHADNHDDKHAEKHADKHDDKDAGKRAVAFVEQLRRHWEGTSAQGPPPDSPPESPGHNKRSRSAGAKRRLSPRESYEDWFIPPDEILIGQRIGSGSYGTVFRAHWHGPVAVKTLNKANTPTPAQLTTFKNEVSVLRKTRHTNILLFVGCVAEPSLAIVTQWCEGSSLLQHLYVLETPMQLTNLLEVARQTAQGMDYLHAKYIIHRDLKSANIFLREDWSVKIGDFGLATVKTQFIDGVPPDSEKLPRPAGSIMWMSPEIMRMQGPSPYSFSSDVYAYGIVLYELMVREFPYPDHNNKDQILWLVGCGRLRPDSTKFRKDTPSAIRKLFHKCIMPDRDQRPAFLEILTVLEGVMESLSKLRRRSSEPNMTRVDYDIWEYDGWDLPSPGVFHYTNPLDAFAFPPCPDGHPYAWLSGPEREPIPLSKLASRL